VLFLPAALANVLPGTSILHYTSSRTPNFKRKTSHKLKTTAKCHEMCSDVTCKLKEFQLEKQANRKTACFDTSIATTSNTQQISHMYRRATKHKVYGNVVQPLGISRGRSSDDAAFLNHIYVSLY
jgi:hypothetical protein